MKRFFALALSILMLFALTACGPEKHSGFVSGGDNFTAKANDGDLILQLKKGDPSENWIIENESELIKTEGPTEQDDQVEYHMTAQKEGSDTIIMKHVKADGSEEQYILTFKTSRQGKDRVMFNSTDLTPAA